MTTRKHQPVRKSTRKSKTKTKPKSRQDQQKNSRPAVWAIDPSDLSANPSATTLNLVREFIGPTNSITPVYVSPLSGSSNKGSPKASNTDAQPECEWILKERAANLSKFFLSKTFSEAKVLYTGSKAKRDWIHSLLRYTNHLKAQLILISSHGRSGLDRVILGSFAEPLLEESSVPLLFVPLKTPPPTISTRALFATDFSPQARRAFHEFLKFVQGHSKEIILYNAVHFPSEIVSAYGAAGVAAFLPQSVVNDEATWAKKQEKIWITEAKAIGINAHFHAIVQDTNMSIGLSILDIATRERIGILGLSSHNGILERSLFGSITRDVFRSQTHLVWVCGPKHISHRS